MPPLSLNQSAKAAKKSKATLLEAIHTGRLSAVKDDKNQWQIEPSELFRCYPQNQSDTGTENRDLPSLENQSSTDLLVQILATEKAERDRERQQLQATIDDLRHRLDKESEERRRLTNILTHQREPAQNQHNTTQDQSEPVQEPDTPAAKTESQLWRKLFGRG